MPIQGSACADIDAAIEDVYAVAADAARAPRWQPELTRAEILELDDDGRQTLLHVETDLKLRTVGSEIRFAYDEPYAISWTQQSGPLKSVVGGWAFEELDGGATRATCTMRIDLGRRLGILFRGPIVGHLRADLIESMPGRLKVFVESAARCPS